MRVSKSAMRIRDIINNAIINQFITRDEYDIIINITSEDGYIDKQEEVILREFHKMIHDKYIRFKTE